MKFYLDYFYKGSQNNCFYVESTPLSTMVFSQYGEQIYSAIASEERVIDLINFLDKLSHNLLA